MIWLWGLYLCKLPERLHILYVNTDFGFCTCVNCLAVQSYCLAPFWLLIKLVRSLALHGSSITLHHKHYTMHGVKWGMLYYINCSIDRVCETVREGDTWHYLFCSVVYSRWAVLPYLAVEQYIIIIFSPFRGLCRNRNSKPLCYEITTFLSLTQPAFRCSHVLFQL